MNDQYECIKQYVSVNVGNIVELEYYPLNKWRVITNRYIKSGVIIDAEDLLTYFKLVEVE